MGDYRTTSGEDRPVSRKSARRRRWLIFLAVLLVLGSLIAAGILIKVERYATAAGYVTTEEYAEVRPGTTGTVAEIKARTGEFVEAGALLVQLNAMEENASLEEARNHVQKAEVELERRKAQIVNDLERRRVTLKEQKQNHADAISVAKLQLQNAQSKLAVTKQLVERGLKAKNALEDEELKEELAQVRLASLLAKDLTIYDELLAKDEATFQTELSAMAQEMRALNDAVKRAEARVRAKEIRAPISGRLLRYEFVVGELVRPESVLYEIFGGELQVLKLRVGERYSAKVAVGQRYSAILAPYRGVNTIYFKGQIQSLRNVIQAEGKSTYRVAYCDFHGDGLNISPGTTAEARIYYGKSCLWYFLLNIDS
jgi:multidrug resistance efflux pump